MPHTAQPPAPLPPLPWRLVRWRMLPRLGHWLAAVLFSLGCGWGVFLISKHVGLLNLEEVAAHRLELVASAIDGVVNRLSQVPSVVELSPEVQTLFREPHNVHAASRANVYLEQLKHRLGGLELYVLNDKGVVVAASNWNQPSSFVGEDLSFRPYFYRAYTSTHVRYFAIGTTTQVPGYYVSHAVRLEGKVVGVAVLKVSLSPLEESWDSVDAPALIADGNGIVLLSSVPEWRYTYLRPLLPEIEAEFSATRQFEGQALKPFPVQLPKAVSSGQRQRMVLDLPVKGVPRNPAVKPFLALSRPMPDNDWDLVVFSDLRPVHAQAAGHAMIGTLLASFLWLLALFLAQRQRVARQRLDAQHLLEMAYAQLERKVADRTADLLVANQQLQAEVAERQRAEQTLRAAQDELVHAGKMAALGQMATEVTHELTQPLGAIRTLSDNAIKFIDRNNLDQVRSNLEIVGTVVVQMADIIQSLKSFGRKAPPRKQAVDMAQAIKAVQFLFQQKLRQVEVQVDCPPGSVVVWCDANRLQQVLTNLVVNALDAMGSQPHRLLHLRARVDGGMAVLRVRDNGPGLEPDVLARLFEPFFSTKTQGGGLGLGLAISLDIVREAGGTLVADNHPAGGAQFTLSLPLVPDNPDDAG